MNRKAIVAGILVCLIVVGSVFAQGTVVTIGGNYWRGVIKGQGLSEDNESKAGNLFGPYINLRFDKVTLGGSWFFGKWDFGTDNVKYEIKRSDLNLSLGYSLSNNFTLFGAYKILKLTEKYESDNFSFEGDSWKVPYIGGGVSLTFPFQNSPLFLFGSAAYLVHAKDKMEIVEQNYFTGEDETVEYKVDDNITSFTVGLGARLDSGISILVGYRADVHKSKQNDDDLVDSDTYSLGGSEGLKINGLFATIAFSFRQ